MSHRRVFTDSERQTFLAAIARMRQDCLEVCRAAPVTGPDYRAAAELVNRLDDAVEALTGDRRAFWLAPHSSHTA